MANEVRTVPGSGSPPQFVGREAELGSLLTVLDDDGPVLDTYEVFRFLDTWLRETFLPSLGANVRLVLAGREPPVTDWLASARWHALVRSVALEPLGDAPALELLSRNGVGEREALHIN